MKKTSIHRWIKINGIALVILAAHSAWAAKNGKIVSDQAKVFEFPRMDAALVSTVSIDSPVQISNQQTNGFFKVRIPGGQVGWIFGTDVLVTTPEMNPKLTEKINQSMTERSPDREEFQAHAAAPASDDRSRLQIYGGIQTIPYSGLPGSVDASDAQSGIGVDLETQFQWWSMLYGTARLEYLSHSGSIVRFKSLPILVGLSFVPISTYFFRFGIGFSGGITPLTSFVITKNDLKAEYSSIDWIALGNVQTSFRLSKRIALLLSAEYRMHQMNAPASSDPEGLLLPAYTVDFGGIAYRAGFEFRF